MSAIHDEPKSCGCMAGFRCQRHKEQSSAPPAGYGTLYKTRDTLPSPPLLAVLGWNAQWKRFEVVLAAHVISEPRLFSHWCELPKAPADC